MAFVTTSVILDENPSKGLHISTFAGPEVIGVTVCMEEGNVSLSVFRDAPKKQVKLLLSELRSFIGQVEAQMGGES